jgi:hypothetical protein
MKYIITESQYNRIAQSHNRLWILRRYEMVRKAFMETLKYVDPCRYDSFERYEIQFYHNLMDEIHESYYLIDGFEIRDSVISYDGVMEELKDLFYVDLTETYYDRKQRCV